MKYDEIKNLTLQLSYRDKFRLAQLLIQTARKEEEEQYVEKVKDKQSIDIDYVTERLLKSRPAKFKSLENFISAMFQYKGAISDEEKSKIIKALEKKKVLRIENNKINYLI
ncbi:MULTISPECIES: hypothetical protein [Acinetobacter]|uniref:hypothetical protein n=1 Tax=Acinetobacter TaxID=469 RepID=UPI00077865FA|nr:hypothetical protein [Acinetobacter venetianus]KXZ65629.1 hypothetical protein AVENLUH7437_01406 [Acinetobacter venetianus]